MKISYRCRMLSLMPIPFVVLAGCAASGIGEGGASDDPVAIAVVVTAPSELFSVPWLVGQDQGFFENRGVIVDEIVAGRGGSQTVRSQLAGDIPIAEAGLGSVFDSRKAGGEVTVVGGGAQSPFGLDFFKVASNTRVSGIDSIHKWGYSTAGSTSQAMTYMLPAAAGIPADEVEHVATGGLGEGVALLESGAIDVAVVPPSLAASSGDKFERVVSSAEYVKWLQQSVITTTPEYARTNPEVVRAVVAGYADSVAWINENPGKAAELYTEYNDLPPGSATELLEEAVDAQMWSVGFNPDALTSAAEAFAITGAHDAVDYCEALDPQFIPENVESHLPESCR
ncbi:ABC transporter substrate-binding protein [Rhodococcus sp. USK10]|uniref:ABC transporter substrate-binding protein n=1 Tax=Rhodococcus sp. USK10 TaxID=2789739 RepID=UPI0021514D8E|nr:ABC transporter substrate-binding protein [Rhodococcus sp. USK10]